MITSPAPAANPWWRIYPVWAAQELRLLLREPVAVFFSLAFPLVIYVFIGIPYSDTAVAPGVTFIDVMFPALLMTVASNLLIMGLPIYLAELRSRRADRRYAILPLPGAVFAAAALTATLTMVAAGTGIIAAVVGLRDGLRPEAVSAVFVLLVLGGLVWMSALGFFLGSLPLGARTTQALSAVVFFTMFFGSGAAVPLDGLPGWLQSALNWNPLKQWLDVMVGHYTGTGVTSTEAAMLWMALPLTVVCVVGGLALWRRRA